MRTIKQNTKKVSAAKEDYLRAVYLLQTYDKATVTKVSEKLGLSKSTVSERMKDLAKDGLVTADLYSDINLTKEGKMLGEKLTYKHRLIEVFLHETLNMSKKDVHAEAEKIEHACSDEVIKLLAKFLNYPTHDPHGSKLPNIKEFN